MGAVFTARDPEPRPARCDQGDRTRARARPGVRRPLPARGADRGDARTPQRRPRVRDRGVRRDAVHGDASDPWADAPGRDRRPRRARPGSRSRPWPQLGAALDAAHSRGLVHRDVKPANVLLSRSGDQEHLFLADFGLARDAASTSGVTETGQWIGTVDFVAPEILDQSGQASARSDVYSMSCLMFQALTGRVPYAGPVARKLAGHAVEPLPSIGHGFENAAAIDAVLARGGGEEARWIGFRLPVELAGAFSDAVQRSRARYAVGPSLRRCSTPLRSAHAEPQPRRAATHGGGARRCVSPRARGRRGRRGARARGGGRRSGRPRRPRGRPGRRRSPRGRSSG